MTVIVIGQGEELSRVWKWVTDDEISQKGPALRSYWWTTKEFALHRGVINGKTPLSVRIRTQACNN